MKVNLLVIDKDDCFLPKGWISAALPAESTFSDYERKCGLWRIMQNVDTKDLRKNTNALHPATMPLVSGNTVVHKNPGDILAPTAWLWY